MRGLMLRSRLLQSDDGVLHIHANLIDLLPLVQFALAQRELIVQKIGLRGPVAQWNVELESHTVVRIVAAEDLVEQVTEST